MAKERTGEKRLLAVLLVLALMLLGGSTAIERFVEDDVVSLGIPHSAITVIQAGGSG